MRIGALATATGLSRDTLRFYEQRGLIDSTRSDNGYRQYAAATVELLGYIRTAQQLGFSLAEIHRHLPALRSCSGPSPAIATLLLEKLWVIDARLEALQQLRAEVLAQLGEETLSTQCQPSPE
ncbi:MAG: MerR family transcriptional regulator [Pseudomonas sp.]|uniref:MerR family transcriptional regulator n=1 Tax=Pseudomonas sp. TaxID=306 RepID=UPI00339A3C4F